MNSSENKSGKEPQVVQSYGIDSLVGVSSLIEYIREYHFRQIPGKRSIYKQIQQYPHADVQEPDTGILSVQILKKLYGKRAPAIRKILRDRGYCSQFENSICALSWRFRTLTLDDFDIGLGSRVNSDVYHSLEALLWKTIPEGAGIDSFLDTLQDKTENKLEEAYRITDVEYWFRQGISIFAFHFKAIPSPELISLIAHKLQGIQQEKMQNYFHIISSFNADSTVWKNERNRSRRFFEIIEQLLIYTWRIFDMKSCEVSIDAAGDEGMIASGSLRVDFSDKGVVSSRFDRMEKRFSTEKSISTEFIVNDVALRAAESANDSSYLSLYMVSRSAGNVDPRQNMLTHRFVKLFIESVGKLIDVIMPVIRREEAIQNLRWRYFLDSLRLRALDHGENLHFIVSDSLEVLRTFFGISEVNIFSEDKDINHMLDFFSRGELGVRKYKILDHPLAAVDILKRQLLLFPIREIPGGRVLLYFDLPRTGSRPLNPESPDQYLMGTEVWNIVNGEALILGATDLKDYLFFMVTECLTANPKAALANLTRRLPLRGYAGNVELMIKLGRRIMERLSRFFDLFQALSANMESGLAYMRGRRDNLTGLYNRQHFNFLLHDLFSSPGSEIGLIFLDMDNFKIFNDTVSHDFGDKLLVSLAHRLTNFAETIGVDAVPGRFGGDEFCFYLTGMDKEASEKNSVKLFRSITGSPLKVAFYFDDRIEGEGMDINLISFLHRLMRPDVGSRQASQTEYIEKAGQNPKNYVVDIWRHYRMMEDKIPTERNVRADLIIHEISAAIEDKILYNKIFTEIDKEFSRIIRIFISLQLKNYTTNRIREYLINEFNSNLIERDLTLKVSAGLAHNSENRLRSLESLFKAADSRAYLAKQNGRNCLFGEDSRQLA